MIISITKNNIQSEVYDSPKPVILDFYGEWCGPCKKMEPIFKELSEELTHYKFAKVNVDEAREVATEFQISSIPTFVFIQNGKIIDKITQSMAKADLKQIIQDTFTL